MHAIPEKLAAMRQSIEATMCRQVADLRQELETKSRDAVQAAEQQAVRRAEERLAPQISALDERVQAHLQALQARLEETFPKIANLSDHHAGTRAELHPLHSRADAAAARLDRLAVQTATTTKDHHDLHQEFKDSMCRLREQAEGERKLREELGIKWEGQLSSATAQAQAATQAAMARADDQAKHILQQAADSEQRLSARLDATAERSLKESKLGDEDVVNRLRPEIQAVANTMTRKVEETSERAENLVRSTAGQLREEMEAADKRIATKGEQCVEDKAGKLAAEMHKGLEAAAKRSESIREGADAALHDATTVLRKCIADTRSQLSSEADVLRNNIVAAETRAREQTEESELRAVNAAAKRLEDEAAAIRKELDTGLQASDEARQNLKKEVLQKFSDAGRRLEKLTEETGRACDSTARSEVGRCAAAIRAELAEVLRSSTERTDASRCASADELHAEVQARKEAFAASDKAREAVAASIREELARAAAEGAALANTLVANLGHRIDASSEDIKGLEKAHEAAGKENADTATSIRNQLREERQRTEEADNETSKLTVQVRDTLEARLQSEVHELRGGMADCRKKIYEESNELRVELRQQPSKREVAEVAATSTQQYTELVASLEGHRARMDAAVADFSSRTREGRNESNEARLRTQRETMALGHELATLRAASSSLANGTLRALQVIGFLREEVDLASAADARRAIAAQAAGGEAATLRQPAKDGSHIRSIEVEDLLEWEKVGKSLSTRVSRHWQPKESSGIPTILSMIDRKAESQELEVLRALIRECSPGAFSTLTKSMGGSTMIAPPFAAGKLDSGSLMTMTVPRAPAAPRPDGHAPPHRHQQSAAAAELS